MIDHIKIENILFLDIECVPGKPSYGELDETFQELWAIKAKSILRRQTDNPTEEEIMQVYERAGIYAEFGKIVCISVGFVRRDKSTGKLSVRLKSFADHDEKQLLTDFCELLRQHYNNPSVHYICGHNIKEFDIPYVCRRLVVNQLEFPGLLQIHGKKPWELNYLLDTMTLWKFGDIKNYTSLKLLAAALGFPSPKDDIDGSDVWRVYWQEKDLERIAHYCEKDVLATVQLFLRYRRMPLIEDEMVVNV